MWMYNFSLKILSKFESRVSRLFGIHDTSSESMICVLIYVFSQRHGMGVRSGKFLNLKIWINWKFPNNIDMGVRHAKLLNLKI